MSSWPKELCLEVQPRVHANIYLNNPDGAGGYEAVRYGAVGPKGNINQ
jgi:hypothetical protein